MKMYVSSLIALALAARVDAAPPTKSMAVTAASRTLTDTMLLLSRWQLQEAAKVPQTGDVISKVDYRPSAWHRATVPGTVLTSLVNNGIYPEPLYGENNRPDRVPV